MLLFSVHPEPEGRKVDKMLTLKKVKEMVKAPVHTKRVPSPKVLLEDGRILLRKEFEHGSHLTLYHNGYVWFSAGKRNIADHQMNLFEDFIGYQSSTVLDEPEREAGTTSIPIPQREESENIPLPDLPGQLENVLQSGNEIAKRGMPT